MRTIHNRVIAATAAAVIALSATGVGSTPAFAATKTVPHASAATHANSDVSAARRHRRSNNANAAAAFGAFAAFAGTIAAIAAANRGYDDGYYSYGGPVYGGGPVYRGHWRGGGHGAWHGGGHGGWHGGGHGGGHPGGHHR